MSESFHAVYLALARQIEREFRVAEWKYGDAEIWPLARMDLYLDMFWRDTGSSQPPLRSVARRVASRVVRPLVNAWRSRADLRHVVAGPNRAGAIFLGDGVSLDRVDGSWQDRFGEPLICALEKQGNNTFLMQSGDLSRLPWKRPTFPANRVEASGWLQRPLYQRALDLPDHPRVMKLLEQNGIRTPSLERSALAQRAQLLCATAAQFERILNVVRPLFAFTVTYYAGLGSAFMLACRRQGILSIDLQHCPQEGAHKAYSWFAMPEEGYKTLPAVFWNWTERDYDNIQSWTRMLSHPWHRGFHGGHLQLAPFLKDGDAGSMEWERKFREIAGAACWEREVLVALQPIGGNCETWNALASQIESSPPGWRWWIRRHPASRQYQDAEFGRLLSLRGQNIVIDEASQLILPALLKHMDVVLSLASGASAEAEMLGVPALFLSANAGGQFNEMIARSAARVIDVGNVVGELTGLGPKRGARSPAHRHDINSSLRHLEQMAREYAMLCHSVRGAPEPNPLQQRLHAGSNPPSL